MATHDYVINDQTTPAFRSDLNNALSAIVSNNSSASEPSSTYANMWWMDTTNNYLKIRDKNDANWIIVGEMDVTNSRMKLISDSLQAASAGGIDILNSSGTKIIDLQVASQATAEAGTNNTELMTPLRVKQSIDENVPVRTTIAGQSVLGSSTSVSTSYGNKVSVSITPSSTSAKIMVQCVGTYSGPNNSSQVYGYAMIKRGTTSLTATEQFGSLNQGDGGFFYGQSDTVTAMIIDEPNTTSSVTYHFAAKTNTSSATLQANARIIAYEIAGV